MPKIARLAVAAVLAMSAGVPACAQDAARGGAVRVEVAGAGRDVVRLVDDATRAVIATDRAAGEPVLDSQVSPDGRLVAVRRRAADGADGLDVYAVAPGAAALAGPVLVYRPRDGRLAATLRTVPNGTVLEVRSGRHAPSWVKVFLYDRARAAWREWPRALEPNDPTAGVPRPPRAEDSGRPYAAWLRSLR